MDRAGDARADRIRDPRPDQGLSRRELLEGGALVVGFSILGPLSKASA